MKNNELPLIPVMIQVYTRKQHFINCVESLLQCHLADRAHLIIASDAGKTESDRIIVREIREYCNTIKGVGKIEVMAFEENLGTWEVLDKVLFYIFSKYDRVIYLEDDNIISPSFLEYISDGLDFYKDDPSVFSVCGYCPPIKIKKDYPYDIITHTTCCAWGIGFWKDKFLKVDFYLSDYKQQIYNIKTEKKLIQKMSYRVFSVIERIVEENKKLRLGDVAVSYHCYINGMCNVYPRFSLVRNMGFDGTGLNMKKQPGFSEQPIRVDLYRTQFVMPPPKNNYIDRQFFKFQTAPYSSTFKTAAYVFRYWTYQFWVVKLLRSWWRKYKRKIKMAECQK